MNLFGNYKINMFPDAQTGVSSGLLTDMARAKYGFPLDGETPERFLATKVPQRKNKDFRARFRNFVIGYPVYKKDNYMRHYYNLVDIITRDAESPLIRYPKIYLIGYVSTFFPVVFAQDLLPSNQALSNHKLKISYNFHSPKAIIDDFRMAFHFAKPYCNSFSITLTSWMIIYDYLHYKRHYSKNESMLKSSMIISPILCFIIADRPVTGFWYRAVLLGLVWWGFASTFSNRQNLGYGHTYHTSEKVYLKGVSKEEIEKIEFTDIIEGFSDDFQHSHSHNMYEHNYNCKQNYLELR